MKVVIVAELFWPSIGGLQSRYMAWGRELVRQRCEVEVWCIADRGGLPEGDVVDGIAVRRLVRDTAYTRSWWGRRRIPTIFRFCVAIWKRRQDMATADAVVFAKWPILPALLLPLPSGPAVFFDWCETRSGWFWRALYSGLLRRLQFTHIAIHSGIGKWLVAHGISPHRLLVIGSAAAAPAELRPVQRVNGRVVFVGRLNEHKQPLLLLDAFASSGLAACGGTLLFAGFGPQLEELREAGRQVPGVEVLGEVSEATKFGLLASATLVALPSLREGFPIVLAEACAVGTPTITVAAVDNGTVHLVEELHCGWVCASNLVALADALRVHAWSDDHNWQACSAAARARAGDTLAIDAQMSYLLRNVRRAGSG